MPASALGALAALASFSSCVALPEDNGVKKGTSVPEAGRRPDDDKVVTPTRVDPCKTVKKESSSKTAKQAGGTSTSKVLYQNDFEKPNVPLVADCGKWLDQSGINGLYGNDSFIYYQADTVEGVLVRDENGVYIDESGRGGEYAIGMLSKLQDDLLGLEFANDMPVVNVRLDLSGIAIKGCGTPVSISQPKLRISLYQSPDEALPRNDPARFRTIVQGLGEPLDSLEIEGNEPEDAWSFDWRTAVAPLDASGVTNGKVLVVFDLLEGGYAAMDNISIVASTKKGVVDADNNNVPDDEQCTAGGTGASNDGDEVEDAPKDAGTRSADAGTKPKPTTAAEPEDAGTPEPPAEPTPAPTPTPTPTRPTAVDAGTPSGPAVQDAGRRTSRSRDGG